MADTTEIGLLNFDMISLSRLRIASTVAVFLFAPLAASAATLQISPSSKSAAVGDTVTMTVLVSSADQALNAVSGTISFPTELLSVISVTKSTTVITLWVQDPSFSNTAGTVDWSGVVPNPGYTGSGGQVVVIKFRAKKAGTASLTFTSSAVLANDGNGTNILNSASPSTITISAGQTVETPPAPPKPEPAPTKVRTAATITSSTHPDQNAWYSSTHVVLDWTNDQGVTGVRIGYDKDADGIPTVSYTEPISHKELDLTDGISYFHMRQKSPDGWGPISTFRVQIDETPPLPIALKFPSGQTTASTSIPILFATTDELSGIDHYQVTAEDTTYQVSAENGSRVYSLATLRSGEHTLIVRAFDKAGNSSSAEAQYYVTRIDTSDHGPAWLGTAWRGLNYLSILLLIIALILLVLFLTWYPLRHFHFYRRRVIHKLARTHDGVHASFAELKQVIEEEVAALDVVKSRRELTKEEARLIARLKRMLDKTEQTIEHEIDAAMR